eukprot:Phypoly_transcript_11080.p1 GENE.Phypoly_transcript_11080~~Phypoly_transcript_11080.p1  ORF type:complete len:365 (+),score=54.00 Phypoly_transcript_11080:92-1186(+)
MSSKAPHFPIKITRSDKEMEEVKVLLEKAAPFIWKSITKEEFDQLSVKRFLLSTSNRVYKCTLGKKHVMVRVFGDGASLLVDREHEVQVTRTMCAYHLAAKIYCSFDNGYIVKYIEGDAINVEQMYDPHHKKLIAEKVAEWHCSLSDIPSASTDTSNPLSPSYPHTKGKRGIWVTMHKWLAMADVTVPAAELEVTKREILETEARLTEKYAHVPLLMCHNDLNYGNILYNGDPSCPENKRIAFVDYEYAGYNFRGFDVGNHFNEYGGLVLDFSKYPSREARKEFARYYSARCKQLGKLAGDVETDAEKLVEESEDFAQVSHLLWSVWSLVIAHTPDKPGDFDYVKYGELRMKEYFARKPERAGK